MSNADLAERIKKADDQFKAKLPGKLNEIKKLWDHLRYVQWSSKHLDTLYRAVHVLVGGAGTLGYNSLHDLLRQIDQQIHGLINDSGKPHSSVIDRVDALLTDLEGSVKAFGESARVDLVVEADSAESQLGQGSVVFLVDDDHVVLKVLGAQLQGAGFKVQTFDSLAKLYTALKEQTPSLIVLDIVFPQGALAGVDALQSLRIKAGFKVPVIFISARYDIVARLKALRAGGSAFIPKPVDVKLLSNTAHKLINEESRHRVLIVDDDPVCSLTHENYLMRANCQVKSLSNPLEVLKQIKHFKPDVVLLDLMMPNCNGIEIAQILRQEQATYFLPIIFLTASDDPGDIKQIEAISHSSFLAKPVEPEKLASAVLAAAREYLFFKERFDELESVSASPSLVSRYELYGRLDELLSLPEAEREHHALVYIAPKQLLSGESDLLKISAREHHAIQRVLVATLGEGDLISGLSDAIFVVLKSFGKQAPVHFVQTTLNKLDTLKLSKSEEQDSLTFCSGVLLLKGSRGRVAQLIEQTEKAAAVAAQDDEEAWHVVNQPVTQTESKEVEDKEPVQAESVVKAQPAHDAQLFKAIEEKRYFLQFQPVVDVADPSFDAYEVLVRLHGLDNRDYAPEQFIPELAKKHQLKELDRWVYTNAIDALKRDQQAYLNSILFLKVTRESLQQKVTIPVVSNLLRESRIKGDGRLVFLLHHDQILKDVEGHLLFARQVKSIHGAIAVEHFSLDGAEAYFSKLQPEYIKIDADRIREAAKHSSKKHAMGDFVRAQKERGAKVIAASVEELSVMQQCYTWGIKHFQGYAIQPPGDDMHRDFDFEEG
ncbi:MAG: response regulator [Oleiphilaceae bacterium]|nr:response regulator [Oleiphilaceae bacterium]